MKDLFFKFPSTPHLATLAGIDVRGDKVMTESERHDFLQHELIVEEKVDGANLGISFDAQGNIHAQNRGKYLILPGSGQWKLLGEWLSPRLDALFEHLSDRYILFGEWCYAKHSVSYDRLPDWFLGFDIFDKQHQKFMASSRRNTLFKAMGIFQVPTLARGHFTLPDVKKLLAHSHLCDHPAEGVYLRADGNEWLLQRAKLVRSGFIQAIEEHWSRGGITPNRLSLDTSHDVRENDLEKK